MEKISLGFWHLLESQYSYLIYPIREKSEAQALSNAAASAIASQKAALLPQHTLGGEGHWGCGLVHSS